MDDGHDRHTKRHTSRRQRGHEGSRGKWQRHLLMHARRAELERNETGVWRPWVASIVSALDPRREKAKSNFTKARAALSSLEEHGQVVASPSTLNRQEATRIRVTKYRLTPKGRQLADELLANNGQTPNMVARAARDARRSTAAYTRFTDALARARVVQEVLGRIRRSDFLEADELRRALEDELGPEPDPDHPDLVKRAAARYYWILATNLDLVEAKHQADREAEPWSTPETEEQLNAESTFIRLLGLGEDLD